MQSMRIALFGGSFDPPHVGHLQVAKEVIRHKIVDDVWFIPCADHPFRKQMTSAVHRVAMLKLLSDFPVQSWELHREGPSYSIDTLEYAAKTFPEHTFFWLLGSDQLQSFQQWHRWKDLLAAFVVLVYPRMNFPLTTVPEGMIALPQLPQTNISSSQIRDAVREKKSIGALVPTAIARYIQTHALYKV